jgi:preprotein translocase subunit SecY
MLGLNLRDWSSDVCSSDLIPFYFGGTSVLIVVAVTMDTINQVQSHLLAHQYEGLLERSQPRGKKRGAAPKKGPSRR